MVVGVGDDADSDADGDAEVFRWQQRSVIRPSSVIRA